MKTITFSIFILLFPLACLAQSLKGVILDADTKEPIVGANVYLNGTTLGSTTDAFGKYDIAFRSIIYTELIISYIGYEKIIIDKPFQHLPDTIFLQEIDYKLKEVSVKGKPTFSERQKRRAFREQFLGKTKGGYSCRILNEKDIRIIYDPETNKLHAYSDVPIEIYNNYLGYKVRWEFIDFTLVLNDKKSLASHNIDSVSIIGTASFTDISNGSEKTSLIRKDTYNFSRNRFFFLLANEKLIESDIRFFDYVPKGEKLNPAFSPHTKWFKVKNNPEEKSIKDVTLNHKEQDSLGITKTIVATIITIETTEYTSLDSRMKKINYTTSSVSRFYLLTDTFSIDSYGNTNLVKNLFITGSMGHHKIGDQLPLNYLPPSK